MRMFQKLALMIALIMEPVVCAQSANFNSSVSANDLARAVIANELKREVDRSGWIYDVDREESGKRQTKKVVQTPEGSLERLIAVDGRVLPSNKQQEEVERIEKSLYDSREQEKLKEDKRKDAEEREAFFKMIPDVFVVSYQGREGEFIKLSFKPNPTFQPSSREGRVLHAMEGELVVQARKKRLASISGHLVEEVKFGGGLLGHLERGGTFSVTRTEVAPDIWMMAGMNVNMKGKALFLKNIAMQEKEDRSNFRKLGEDLTLKDAANILANKIVLAVK